MKKKMYLLFATATVLSSLALSKPISLSAINGESFLNYLLIHPFHKVEAMCKELTCIVQYDDATHIIVETAFSADVTSFDSGNSNRDSHAMEVLDALTFPTVSFQSKNIANSENQLQVTGDLTFHGVTKTITFSAMATSAGLKLTVQGNVNVSLTAFQVERPSLLMIPVQDTLRVSFTMVFPISK